MRHSGRFDRLVMCNGQKLDAAMIEPEAFSCKSDDQVSYAPLLRTSRHNLLAPTLLTSRLLWKYRATVESS